MMVSDVGAAGHGTAVRRGAYTAPKAVEFWVASHISILRKQCACFPFWRMAGVARGLALFVLVQGSSVEVGIRVSISVSTTVALCVVKVGIVRDIVVTRFRWLVLKVICDSQVVVFILVDFIILLLRRRRGRGRCRVRICGLDVGQVAIAQVAGPSVRYGAVGCRRRVSIDWTRCWRGRHVQTRDPPISGDGRQGQFDAVKDGEVFSVLGVCMANGGVLDVLATEKSIKHARSVHKQASDTTCRIALMDRDAGRGWEMTARHCGCPGEQRRQPARPRHRQQRSRAQKTRRHVQITSRQKISEMGTMQVPRYFGDDRWPRYSEKHSRAKEAHKVEWAVVLQAQMNQRTIYK
jgi:hypothetical protein